MIGMLLFLLLTGLGSFSQNRIISGKVTGKDEVSIPGVTVVVKGTTNGTITDMNGNYSLQTGPGARILVFSYIGMKTREVVISTSNVINVVMEEEAISMDEVVVVGYGTQRRSDIAGSVATVKTDELIAKPTTDLQGMLKGQISGLYVTLSDARPGGSSNVLLRGVRSLKGGNEPLYVVDGVPIGSINEINIDDVGKHFSAEGCLITGDLRGKGIKRGHSDHHKTGIRYQKQSRSFLSRLLQHPECGS